MLGAELNEIVQYKVPDSHEFDITLPETFVIIFTRHSEGREQINTQV